MARPYTSFDITTTFASKLNEMSGLNSTFVLRFTGNIPDPDGGATALVKTASDDFIFIAEPFPTFTNASDAIESIGSLFSPSLPLNCTDIDLGTITLHDLFGQANEYEGFLPNAFTTPFYANGVYCTITKQIGAGAVVTIFRGFVNRDDLTKTDDGGLNPAVNVSFDFTLIDRHRLFLESTTMETIADEILANVNLQTLLMPDKDVENIENVTVGGYLIYRNSYRETESGGVYTITQAESLAQTQGTYMRMLAWQEIANILNTAAGCEHASGVIDLSHFVAKYDERYAYSTQANTAEKFDPTIGTNPLSVDGNGSNLHKAYAPVSKLLQLDDTSVGGVNWSGVDVGESWSEIENGLELVAAICAPYLVCRFNDVAGVVQMQLTPRNDYAATIDLDAMIAAGTATELRGRVTRPFAAKAKYLTASERDGGDQLTYPDEVMSKSKEEVHATVINRHYKASEFEGEAAVRNFYYWRNSQTVNATQGVNEDHGYWEILKIISTPNLNGVAYAIGISTDPETGTQSPIIFKTTDSGVNWYLLAYSDSGLLRDGVALLDTAIILVGDGGKIIKSLDGGATWVEKTSNVTGNIIAVGLATGTTYYAITGEAHGFAIKSTDSGETWVTLTSPAWTGATARFTAMNVAFIDTVVDYISLVVGVRDENILRTQIWQTTDVAGETFNATPTQSQPLYREIFALVRTGANTMYAAGGGLSGGLLWHTTDNWGTYSEITSITNNSTNEYHSLYFTTDAAGFVGGNGGSGSDDGINYRTADTGATWAAKRPTGSTFKQVNSLVQVDATPDTIVLGVNAVSSSKSFKYSTDNGDTWTEIYRNVDITNAATACPLRIAWKVPNTSNVRFWTDSNVLTTVALTAFLANVQAPSNYALTILLDVRDVFKTLFLNIATGFAQNILSSADFLRSPLLKFTFIGKSFRAQSLGYDPNVDTTEVDFIEIL